MYITSIKSSKTPNQVWLTFSDQSYLPFFIDDIVKLSLIKNQELDSSQFHQIIKSALVFLGQEYALRQIAISPKTEKIINHKLVFYFQKIISKYKIDINGINLLDLRQQIITFLKNKNLLNENDFISYFVKKNSRKSRQQIIYSLQQLGVNNEQISSAFSDQSNEVEKINQFLQKKKIDKTKLRDYKEKNKIKAALYRRGFSLVDINTAIDVRP